MAKKKEKNNFFKNNQKLIIICSTILITVVLIAVVLIIIFTSNKSNSNLGRVTIENYYKIEEGMRLNEVKAILGEPDNIGDKNIPEIDYYLIFYGDLSFKEHNYYIMIFIDKTTERVTKKQQMGLEDNAETIKSVLNKLKY